MTQELELLDLVSKLTDQQLSEWLSTTTSSGTPLQKVAGIKLAKYALDPLQFGRDIFPHHFRLPSPSMHRSIIRLTFPGVGESGVAGEYSLPVGVPQAAEQNPSLLTALAAPRGFAKSTLVSLLRPIWGLWQRRNHFMVIVSNTHDQAVKFLQAIKYEVETNQKLRALRPEIRPNKEKWADADIELYEGKDLAYKVVAKGAEAQLRGLKFLQYRPDLIIIDDGEDDEMVRSELRRQNFQAWFDNVVLKVNPHAQVIFIGTILAELALLNRIVQQQEPADRVRYGQFQRARFQALVHGESSWPAHQSTEALKQEQEANPYSFSQEKQNEPLSPEYAPFKPEFFTERRWWRQLPTQLAISITIDPAWTAKDYSKETALVCAGWDGQRRLWVLDEYHGKHDDPSEVLTLILDWYQRWTKNEQVNPGHKFYCVGFDTISAQKMLMTTFRDTCKSKQLHPYLKELKADRDKIRRIWQLEPLFREDRIFLAPHMTYVQRQLQGFPMNVQGGLVDVIDALAYHLQLAQFAPNGQEEEVSLMPEPLTLESYIKCHEDTREYLRRFPDWSGSLDARLLAQVLSGAN